MRICKQLLSGLTSAIDNYIDAKGLLASVAICKGDKLQSIILFWFESSMQRNESRDQGSCSLVNRKKKGASWQAAIGIAPCSNPGPGPIVAAMYLAGCDTYKNFRRWKSIYFPNTVTMQLVECYKKYCYSFYIVQTV